MAHPLSSATSVHSVTPVPGLFTATPARLASMLGPRPQGPMHGRARSFTSKPCSSFRALNRRSVSRLPSSRQSRPVHTYISTGGASLADGVAVVEACRRVFVDGGRGWTGCCCWSADTDAITRLSAHTNTCMAVDANHSKRAVLAALILSRWERSDWHLSHWIM